MLASTVAHGATHVAFLNREKVSAGSCWQAEKQALDQGKEEKVVDGGQRSEGSACGKSGRGRKGKA